MARVEPLFNAFTSGELAPRLRARVGTPVYQTGAAKVENAIVLPEGGVERRMGFRHVGSTKMSAKLAALIPFLFSTVQPYVTEWGDLYVRVYTAGALIFDAPELVTNGAFPSSIDGWTDVSESGASVAWDGATRALRIDAADVLMGDRVVNGHFSAGLGSWTIVSGLVEWRPDIQAAQLRSTGMFVPDEGFVVQNPPGVMEQVLAVTPGVPYTLKFRVVSASSTLTVRCGSASQGADLLTAAVGPGLHTRTVIPTTGSLYLSATVPSASAFQQQTAGVLDDVSLEETVRRIAAARQAVTVAAPAAVHTLRFTVTAGPVTLRVGTTPGGQELVADTVYAAGPQTRAVTPGASPIYVEVRADLAGRLVDDVALALVSAVPVEVVTPYAEGDLRHIQTAQSADVLGLVDGRHPPHRLIRTSHTAWFLQEILFFDGPYLPENTTDAWTLVASAQTGSVTLTAAGAGFAPFQAGHVGSTWTLTFGTVRSSVRITAVADATHATATIVKRIDDLGAAGFVVVSGDLGAGWGTPTKVWAEGAWSAVRGYPAAIGKGEGRFWYAYTDTEPVGLWGTVTDEPYSMDPDTGLDGSSTPIPVADSGVDVNLRDTNAIRGMVFSPTGLVLQTVAGEIVANGGGADQAIVPPGPKVRPATDHGGRTDRALPPIQVDRVTLFVNRTGHKLLGFEFSLDLESYVAKDLLRRSRHLAGRRGSGGLIGLAYAGDPEPLVYTFTAEGRLLTLTYEPTEEVFGWAGQTLGASAAGAAVIESMTVIPNAAASADEVWAIVRRTVNGATRRDVERLDPTSGVDLDAHLTYRGAPQTVFGNLGHLIGETVEILADGRFVGTAVVAPDGTDGRVTVAQAASNVAIGLGYRSRLRTLTLRGPGQKKGVAKVYLRVLETAVEALSVTVSAPGATAQRPTLRVLATPADPDEGTELEVTTLGWDARCQVTIESVGPGPWTILGVGLQVETE